MDDEYQVRYLAHQKFGKKQELVALMKERHSNRRFDKREVAPELVSEVIASTKHCPSSCDRHGVRIKKAAERNDKDLLDGLLVGGTGWVYRAPIVLLLFADPLAYKADGGRELYYNSYLDAGTMIQQMSLMATALGLHCAYINPNVRDENKGFFYQRFAPEEWMDRYRDEAGSRLPVFCGAFVMGYPHQEPIEKDRNLIENMEVK